MAGRLQQEIGKREPFACPEQEAALNIARTSDQLRIRFERLFRRHQLTPSQYNVLRILRGEGKPMRVLDIAARTIAEVPGITGLIDRLEEAGLVVRERCSQDRRVVYVAPTPKALSLLSEVDEPLLATHRSLLGHLSPADLAELIRLLEKARAAWADAD
jgi:DNA-binding MarR family transcriptional regulator